MTPIVTIEIDLHAIRKLHELLFRKPLQVAVVDSRCKFSVAGCCQVRAPTFLIGQVIDFGWVGCQFLLILATQG
jgi:hypothetical protein